MPISTIDNSGISASAAISTSKLGTGAVLQVVQGTYSTETSNSTSTFADTGLTASITPSSATSKILILISHPSNAKSASNASNDLGLQLLRGSSSISAFGRSLLYTNSSINNYGSASYCYLDSPSTTSSTTYKTQFKNEDNNGALCTVQVGSSISTMILMEIAA